MSEQALFFRSIRQIPENKVCYECGQSNPEWASASLGILVCLECSGVHRSIGVHLSFVRSVNLDSWTPVQLESMRLGGNKLCREFLDAHGVDHNQPFVKKYATPAAACYRDRLRTFVEGREWKELTMEEINKKYKSGSSLAYGPNRNLSASTNYNQQPRAPSPTNREGPVASSSRGGRGATLNTSGGYGRNASPQHAGGRDWRSEHAGATSISSDSILGKEPSDYNDTLSWEGVSKFANDTYSTVSERARTIASDIDLDTVAAKVRETSNAGWALATDYWQKATQLVDVGDSFNSLTTDVDNGYNTTNRDSGRSHNITATSSREVPHDDLWDFSATPSPPPSNAVSSSSVSSSIAQPSMSSNISSASAPADPWGEDGWDKEW